MAARLEKVKETPAEADALALAEATDAAGAVVDRLNLISEAAYLKAEARGFAPGHELEDWLAAELEVASRLGEA